MKNVKWNIFLPDFAEFCTCMSPDYFVVLSLISYCADTRYTFTYLSVMYTCMLIYNKVKISNIHIYIFPVDPYAFEIRIPKHIKVL